MLYGAFWASLQADAAAQTSTALVQRYQRATTMIGVLPIGKAEPLSAPMSAFFWSTKPDQVETLKRAGIESWKDGIASLWPDCESYLKQINGFDDMTLARYGHHTLAMPVGRSLAVIGDAAHSTSPQLGQGANMALLDARALVHALNTSDDLASALPAMPPRAAVMCAPSRRCRRRLRRSISPTHAYCQCCGIRCCSGCRKFRRRRRFSRPWWPARWWIRSSRSVCASASGNRRQNLRRCKPGA